MPLSDEDVREILRIVDENQLAELRIESEGFSLHVIGEGAGAQPDAPARVEPPHATRREATEAQPAPPASESRTQSGGLEITAPVLGIFYRAEGPGKEPFVDVGSRVEADTIVAIIEVMKMMNSVTASLTGTVVEVCAQNAALVEYGEPLFRVEP